MSISESILIGLFCMAVVFAVLGILWAIIRVFSSIIMSIEKKPDANSSEK
ncbi:OadG family protein [Anaerocolumna sp. AGMB13025]|nr:OadG family protein [Anaerocolumna sp. AGMB13025]WFR59242.1 OadG family protein [Anaerocolumna sp. AGMB13025]